MARGETRKLCRFAAGALAFAAAAAGCAAPPPDGDPAAAAIHEADPYEPFNRFVFSVNLEADRWVLEPVAQAYADTVPSELRDAIHNFLVNMHLPIDVVNLLLQGEGDRAARSAGRFVINTSFGVGGVFDLATDAGLDAADEDFGQTLAVWGVAPGPYLVLPLLGPTTVRAGAGRVADVFLDPMSYLVAAGNALVAPSLAAANLLDRRVRNLEAFAQVRNESLDLYATVRSAYLQRRRNMAFDGAPPEAGGRSPLSPVGESSDPFLFLFEDSF